MIGDGVFPAELCRIAPGQLFRVSKIVNPYDYSETLIMIHSENFLRS